MPVGRIFCSLAVLTAGCLASPSAQAQTAKASLKDASGKDVGQVQLLQTPQGVLLKLSVKGVPAGEHAFHIHAVGKCEGPAFASAGMHWNPSMHKHGRLNPDGAHAGDLPNLVVGADGHGQISFDIMGPLSALLDADGASIVIHAHADDERTDPSGNSGDRMVCAVLIAG